MKTRRGDGIEKPSEDTNLANTLILDSPKRLDDQILLLKPPSLWQRVTSPPEN